MGGSEGRTIGGERGARAALETVLDAALLVVFHGLLWSHFRAHLDVNLWDEGHYLRQGIAIAEARWSEVSYAWSLPFSAIYALLWSAWPERALLADVVTPLCAGFATLSLWWGLRAGLPRSAAFLGACWWAVTSTAIHWDVVHTKRPTPSVWAWPRSRTASSRVGARSSRSP